MKQPDAPEWKQAMEKEMKIVQDLEEYTLVPRSEVPRG